MEERRKNPESLRLRALIPSLTVDDATASVAWYRDIVGFTVAEEMKGGDGELQGAILVAGSARMFLVQDDFAKGRDRAKGIGFRIYCETAQELDELAAAIERRGGTLAQKPQDRPWGTRDFALTDPDGFQLTLSTPQERG